MQMLIAIVAAMFLILCKMHADNKRVERLLKLERATRQQQMRAVSSSLSDETKRATAAQQTLQQLINKETEDRKKAVQAEASNTQAKIEERAASVQGLVTQQQARAKQAICEGGCEDW